MINSFSKAIDFTLQWEGGYSNNPADPGKETNFGISKKSYPHLDIANLTREQAIEIYRRDYWDALGCDDLPYPLDIIAFDTSVNCGVARTKKWMEQANGNSIALFMRRMEHYTYLVRVNKKFLGFLSGWLNRMIDLYKLVTK